MEKGIKKPGDLAVPGFLISTLKLHEKRLYRCCISAALSTCVALC